MHEETQQTIGEWIDATFPGTDPDSPRKAIRALEEMVELCFASGATANEITQAVARSLLEARGPDFEYPAEFDDFREVRTPEPVAIPVEAADVLIVLYGVAHMRGFDLHAEVEKKMAVNRARKWQARGDGTGYHVKPPEAGS